MLTGYSPAIVERLRDQSGGFSSAFVFVGMTALASAGLVAVAGTAIRKQGRAALARVSSA